ncbi:unnamed protein product [Tilletia controversa]|uniref:Uncharacterized protein n=3 Tax=Tilletia TaxID=13289 RepID=A0A8X7MV25_9BASI|nr:hypothetical protein CF336_g6647 [Tilletia laevis]KAE8188295.1 hypothetical protein CF328_g6646 [Tilletia controversa]KAE8248603.1 hypothetical protein A4X03_0g6738 [Tilletia caries]KAE8191689.1 hypothetical protein CF335_g6021 [Tilletia laevis]KAE8248268.1 hypothetical protein A4X06_0g3832 [Tilletia controversa]
MANNQDQSVCIANEDVDGPRAFSPLSEGQSETQSRPQSRTSRSKDQGLWLAAQNMKIIFGLLAGSFSTAQINHTTDFDKGVDKENLAKLRDFYDSCMDHHAQDKVGDDPTLKLVSESWSRLTVRDPTKKDIGISTSPAQEDPRPYPCQGKRQPKPTQAID